MIYLKSDSQNNKGKVIINKKFTKLKISTITENISKCIYSFRLS